MSTSKTRNNKKGIQIYKSPFKTDNSEQWRTGGSNFTVPAERCETLQPSASIQPLNESLPIIRSPYYLNKQQEETKDSARGQNPPKCAASLFLNEKTGKVNSKIKPYHSKQQSAPTE